MNPTTEQEDVWLKEIREGRISRQLQQLDRERKEFAKERNDFAKEQKDQDMNYEDCKRRLDTRIDAIKNAIQDCSEDALVLLNVGGRVFPTLKSTVSNISPFFGCLFSNEWKDAGRKTIRDDNGNIFIDRSPQHFGYLLDWSRNGGDPQELINIVQAISVSSCLQDGTGLNSKINVNTFIKTLEYFGVDYENVDSELVEGNKLDVYWRGDKRTYKGTIKKLYFDKSEQVTSIIISYEDNTSWKYQVNRLDKTMGPYSHLATLARGYQQGKKTKWWHYGEDRGGIKLG
jgi:hypothetical protein